MSLIHGKIIIFENNSCQIIEKSGTFYLNVCDQLRLIKEQTVIVDLKGIDWSVSLPEFITDLRFHESKLIDEQSAVKNLGMEIELDSYEGSYEIECSMTYYTVESKKSYLQRTARNSKIAKTQRMIARERKVKTELKERAELKRLKKKYD